MVVTRKSNVVKVEDVIKAQKQKDVENNQAETTETAKPKQKKEKAEPAVPRGKPKSGRVWKTERKRFSSIVKTKGIRNNFQKKEALRKELSRVKEISKAAKEATAVQKELKKERRRENMKRQEENRKKSEIVQVITNTSKIKKMKKKQLRQIEKRDVTKVGK